MPTTIASTPASARRRRISAESFVTILLPDREDGIHIRVVSHQPLRGAEREQATDLGAVDAVFVALRHRERLRLEGRVLGGEASIRHLLSLPQRQARDQHWRRPMVRETSAASRDGAAADAARDAVFGRRAARSRRDDVGRELRAHAGVFVEGGADAGAVGAGEGVGVKYERALPAIVEGAGGDGDGGHGVPAEAHSA